MMMPLKVGGDVAGQGFQRRENPSGLRGWQVRESRENPGGGGITETGRKLPLGYYTPTADEVILY